MAHNHQYAHEHQHTHALQSLNAIFIVCIVLNVAYVAVEAAVGLWVGSLGLLSDAGHNLSDAFSLLLSLFAFKMAQRRSTARFTYGYRKSTVLVSLLNAVILLVAVGAIVIEAVHKLNSPETVSGAAISWTAGVGIAVNGLTAWLLMRSQKHDLNVKGAFLHMLMDTLVSAGVVVSGIIIMFTGWTVVDSIISLIIAAVIIDEQTAPVVVGLAQKFIDTGSVIADGKLLHLADAEDVVRAGDDGNEHAQEHNEGRRRSA